MHWWQLSGQDQITFIQNFSDVLETLATIGIHISVNYEYVLKLIKENETLRHFPGGPEYQAAMERFDSLKN